MKRLAQIALLLAIASSLSGCIATAVTAAALGTYYYKKDHDANADTTTPSDANINPNAKIPAPFSNQS